MPKRKIKKPAKIHQRKVYKASGPTHFGAFSDQGVSQEVLCSKCNREYLKIDVGATGGICWKCTQVLCGPPAGMKTGDSKPTVQRVQGWRWMKEWVDPDGTVWHKGVEQPKLKGKREPTDPEPIRQARIEKKKIAAQKKEIKLLKHAQKQKEARIAEAKKREELKNKG